MCRVAKLRKNIIKTMLFSLWSERGLGEWPRISDWGSKALLPNLRVIIKIRRVGKKLWEKK